MVNQIAPHGGALINRFVEGEERAKLLSSVSKLKKVVLDAREISDLELLAIGGFSPLEGFMTREDYEEVLDVMRLSSGLPWTIPITLSATKDEAKELKGAEDIALVDEKGTYLAVLHVEERFNNDKEKEADRK